MKWERVFYTLHEERGFYTLHEERFSYAVHGRWFEILFCFIVRYNGNFEISWIIF